MLESLRHHADYLHAFSIELNSSSDNPGIAAKTARPKTIAQDDHVIRAGLKFFRFENSTAGVTLALPPMVAGEPDRVIVLVLQGGRAR